MGFFKRVEVWLLLVLGGGAAAWVLMQKPADVEDAGQPIQAGDTSTEAALVVHRCTLERDYGNARLDLELRYRNTSERPLVLQPPDVKLLTGDGKEVPPFILPVERPPQIAAQTAQDVRVRYWLDKKHLQGTLTLEIRGTSVKVKGDGVLDLEKLENGKEQTWNGAMP